MDERVLRFRVGVVALVAAIITGILVFFFAGGESILKSRYTIYLGFPKTPGVSKDTPVRKNGILIGRVTNVKLKKEGGVELTVKIDKKIVLYHDEICQIGASSLLGDAVLEFVEPDRKQGAPKQIIKHGDFLGTGIVVSDPLSVLVNLESDLREATRSIRGAGDEVAQTARTINILFADKDGQLGRVVQKTETALDSFNTAMQGLNEVVGDPNVRAKIKQALEDLPLMFSEARQTLAETRQTMAGFERVSQRAERNLENLEKFTKPLGEKGEQLVANIDNSIANMDELLEQMVKFSQAINDRQGSLGK